MRLRKKQTSLIAITLIAVLILVWQLVDLMGSDISSNDSAVAADKNQTRVQSALTQPIMNSHQPLLQTEPTQAKSTPLTLQKQNKTLTANKRAYIEMVNRYEVAKMKHKLLQEELAIANTRHQISTLNQQTEAAPSDEHFGSTGFGTESNDNKPQMKLVYLDHQNTHWSATLFDGNQYQQIEVGATLKNDQKVAAINRQGVTIESGNKRFNLNFNGITPLPNKPVVKKSNYTRAHYTHLSPKQKKASVITHKIEQKIINNKANTANNQTPALTPIQITLIKTPVKIKTQPPIKTLPTAKVTAQLHHKKNAELHKNKKPLIKIKTQPPVKLSPITTKKSEISHKKNAKLHKKKKPLVKASPTTTQKPNVNQKKIAELNKKKMLLIKRSQLKTAHTKPPLNTRPVAHPTAHAPAKTSPLKAKQGARHPSLKATNPTPAIKQSQHTKPPVTAKPSSITAKQSPVQIHHTASLDETVLLQMPANSYTIQLRDSHNKNDLLQFAKDHHIDDRTLCYTNKHHRQPYYTLVYGDYLTTRAAKSALHGLPNRLREKSVAVRRLAQIQQEINR